jgi:PAP2 superfamily
MSATTASRTASTVSLAPASALPARTSPLVVVGQGVREVLLIVLAWFLYSGARLLAGDSLPAARRHAQTVLDLETHLHLDVESWFNHLVTPLTWAAVPMSYWYVTLHYVITPLALAAVFLRDRDRYARVRNALFIGSGLALVCYVLLPTAPPRMLGGYVDTLARYEGYGWWSSHASAPAGMEHLTDELAAMPSLHVGWTLWVAWALWRFRPLGTGALGRRVWHGLLAAYVLGTSTVVIGTANHWVLDVLAGLAVVAVGIVVATRVAERRAGRGKQTASVRPWSLGARS